MRIAAVAVLLVSLAVAAVLSARSESFVPLFLWSGRPLFANGHASVSEAVTGSEFRHMFQRVVGAQRDSHSDAKYLNTNEAHAKPEIVVAFVYNHLSSAAASREAGAFGAVDNANFQYLRAAMSSAESSLAAPSLLATTPIGAEIADLHSALAPGAQVFATEIAGDGTDAVNTCDALLQSLEDHPFVFSNKQTDLILVKYADAVQSRADNCMQRVADAVASRTNGNFLALVSSELSAPLQTAFLESGAATVAGVNYVQRFRAQSLVGTTATNTTVYPGVTMLTSNVLWGLIIVLIMIIALSCGVCWVQSIETPARFTSTQLQLAKEY